MAWHDFYSMHLFHLLILAQLSAVATVVNSLFLSDRSYDPLDDPFLAKYGLRELARVPIEGYESSTLVLRKEDQRLVDFPKRFVCAHCRSFGNRGLLVMFDIDSGGRRGSDLSEPGTAGPRLHGLWTHCAGERVETCTEKIPFRPPGGSKTRPQPNRYVLLDFEELELAKKAVNYTAVTKKRFDLAAFLADNKGELLPRAYTVVQVGGPGYPYSHRPPA